MNKELSKTKVKFLEEYYGERDWTERLPDEARHQVDREIVDSIINQEYQYN